jgi:plasmid stability protein
MVPSQPTNLAATMPSLTLKDVPVPLLERLRSRAARDQRSLNREAIWLLEQAMEPSCDPATQIEHERESQLAAWRALAGKWQGTPQDVDDLVADIYESRTLGREVVL